MNNRKITVAVIVIILMFMSIIPSLINRISYEQKTKNVFLSANYDNIITSQLDVDKALDEYHKLGVNFVTIKPETVNTMAKEGLVDIITYSSLAINKDAISVNIKDKLSGRDISDNSGVIIVKSKYVADYLNSQFAVRYNNYIFQQVDENIWIFCFNTNHDIIVGYDRELIKWLGELNLEAVLEYPSYSFQSPLYAEYFASFLKEESVEFLILKENEYDNKKPLSWEFLQALSKLNINLVVFESKDQISNEKPFIYDEMTENLAATLIRGYNATETVKHDKTLFDYRYHQWYNSIIERNTKFINIDILKNEDITNEENYVFTKKAVDKLVFKLYERKYSLDNYNNPVYYVINSQIAVIAGFLIILAFIYIYLLLAFNIRHIDILFLFLGFVSVLLNYVYYERLINIYITILVIISSSIITLYMFRTLASSFKNKIIKVISVSFGILLVSVSAIAAMMADMNYYIGTKNFSEVNLSVLIPLAITVFNYYTVFVKEPKAAIKAIFGINRKYLIAFLAVLFMVIVYYIIRNGKSSLILPFEYDVRIYLTNLFYIRPRFKEFLIGYEALTLFVYLSVYKKKNNAFFAILSTVLFTSILNTYCHAATAFFVSLQRTFNGFLCYLLFLGGMFIYLRVNKMVHKEKKVTVTHLR